MSEMSPVAQDDKGKERMEDSMLLSEGDEVYHEGDEVFVDEFDEDLEQDGSDDYDEDAMSFDDDDLDDEDDLEEEHPFEADAPPTAALLDFGAPQETPAEYQVEPISLRDILPPGSKRKCRPDFTSAATLYQQQ